jgi:hypothetical protein
MANPYTPGTEAYKLFAYAQVTKNNTDKASQIFVGNMWGRGYFDISGGTAVPRTNLPVSSAAAHHTGR